MAKTHIPIFTYYIDLPDGINEAVMACADGYTVYIKESLDLEHRQKAFIHALHHIHNDDFYRSDVQQIETQAHKKGD